MVTTNVVMDFAVRRGWGDGARRGPRNDTEDHGIGRVIGARVRDHEIHESHEMGRC